MTGFNKVILMGHLTRDPESRILPSQTPVCEIGLAVNRRWKDAQGQPKEEVLFIDGTAFGKRAETLVAYFKKGSPIHIEGYLKLERWESDDGSKHSRIRVMIERFSFLDGPGGGAGSKPQVGPSKKPGTRRAKAPVKAPASPAEVDTAEIPF